MPNLVTTDSFIYQMMAYGRLYECPALLLLYPHYAGLGTRPLARNFIVRPSKHEQLTFASIDIGMGEAAVVHALRLMFGLASKAA